jgi:ferric-dicitrate binding protein FerR (iron transport regulator)
VGGRFEIDESDQFVDGLEQSLPVSSVRDAGGGILLLYSDPAAPQAASSAG